mgnify:CR=1 FL=1
MTSDDHALGQRRVEAKARKDYVEADRLRAELNARGIDVVDRADGTYKLYLSFDEITRRQNAEYERQFKARLARYGMKE